MITSRRSFIAGLGAALITAPAIVRAGSLMPVRTMIIDPEYGWKIVGNVVVTGIDMHGRVMTEIIEIGQSLQEVVGRKLFTHISGIEVYA